MSDKNSVNYSPKSINPYRDVKFFFSWQFDFEFLIWWNLNSLLF
jgi:hypothetical protein